MIPILMYHRVADILPEKDLYRGMSMSPEKFDAQMRYLSENGYRAASLSEVLQDQRSGTSSRRKSVVITFDDGYLDNYETAWPILKKYGLTATIFLVADRIGKNNDWDQHAEDPSTRLMKLSEIHEMKQGGIEFGSHTLSHAALTRVDKSEAWRQIHDSRLVLTESIGMPIRFFSYPYDLVDGEVLDMVVKSGYDGACGTSSLPYGPFNLWRTECFGYDSMTTFKMKISGLYNHLVWLRDRTAIGGFLRALKRWRRRMG